MIREPLLTTVAIAELRPTQITVGMREVTAKRKRWQETGTKKGQKFLGRHMIPVILGPKRRHYVIDHHHLALALHEEGVSELAVTVVANLSRLESDEFWTVMDNRGWMHPFDAKGRRRHYEDIPKSVPAMVDDPYRSLAGELRRAGGFAKDTTPFSEFIWADWMRRQPELPAAKVVANPKSMLPDALKLAEGPAAADLPGYRGNKPPGFTCPEE